MALPLSPAGRRYGALPVKRNHLDYGVASVPNLATALPPSVDLEPDCGPVKNQGDLGACTAFAGTGMREFLARRYQARQPILSPMFLYYKERELDGDLGEGDSGSTGRTCCRVLASVGVCVESDDPYAPSDYQTPPTDAQVADALAYKGGSYHSISNVQDMKSCLASGYANIIGFTVYSSFESIGPDGIMPVPNKTAESILGGHEVLVIGYDDSRQAFKVRNSWGSDWGASGNFWMGYALAADPDILMDSFIFHLGKPWGA